MRVIQRATYLLLKAPRISKMMSSNMVQEKANVMEKTTWTMYCRTCRHKDSQSVSTQDVQQFVLGGFCRAKTL